jgi:hypothetical protein
MKRAKADDEEQVVCWTSSAGHLWMRDYYDRLPLSARRRLQDSPHNICPACLVLFFLPKVRAKFPKCSYAKALLITIAFLEKQIEQRAIRPDDAAR